MKSHRDVLVQRATAEGWRRGAELGVGSGLLFERLLTECPNLHLLGVDTFYRQERARRVAHIQHRFSDRCEVFHGSTLAAARCYGDALFDFVFIDAAHSFRAVRADIEAWWPKVKPGGWFGGHDYHESFPGVIQAVQERFSDRGLIVDPHAVWWVRR